MSLRFPRTHAWSLPLNTPEGPLENSREVEAYDPETTEFILSWNPSQPVGVEGGMETNAKKQQTQEDLKFYFITLVKDTKIFFELCFGLYFTYNYTCRK